MMFCLKIRSNGRETPPNGEYDLDYTHPSRSIFGTFLKFWNGHISSIFVNFEKKNVAKLFTIMYKKLWVPQLGNADKYPNQEPPNICGAPPTYMGI